MSLIEDAVAAGRSRMPLQGDSWTNPQAAFDPVPQGTSTLEQHQAKVAREDKAGFGTYLGGMWRQDSWIDGFLAQHAGNTMAPDANYNPYDKTNLDTYTAGVWPEYQKELTKATSAAHAHYLQGLILQKQNDLVNLGDMGKLGNTGRLLFGLVEPSSLLAGPAGGFVAKGMGIARAVNGMSRTARFAAGVGTGATFNAGFEKLRQNYNFEDSTAGVLEAGLVGAAFSAPFALHGVLKPNELERLSKTATREAKVMELAGKDAHTPEEVALVGDHAVHAQEVQARIQDPEGSPIPATRTHEIPAEKRQQFHDAFDAIEAEKAAAKEKDMTQVWGEGQLRKGDEMSNVQAVLDRVNGPDTPRTAMEEAFTRALENGRKQEKARKDTAKAAEDVKAAPEGVSEGNALKSQPEPIVKAENPPLRENPVKVGDDVFWTSHNGDFEAGQVVSHTRDGRLIVEDANTGKKRVVSREELSPDSPGHREVMPEGMGHPPTRREHSPRDSTLGFTEHEASQVIDKAVSSWSHKPSIRVIASNNFPEGVRSDHNTLGFVHNNEVFIVADRHKSPLDLEATLAHEVFHLGVRRMMPKEEYVKLMQHLRDRNPELGKRADAIAEHYKAEWEKQGFPSDLHGSRALEEALADMAQQLHDNPSLAERVVVSVVDAVTDILRAMRLDTLANALQKALPSQAIKFVREVLQGVRDGSLKDSPFHTAQGWIDFRRVLAEEPKLEHTVALAKWRIDTFNRLMKSPNEIHQKLAHILCKDAIGDVNGKAQPQTATEAAWLTKRTVGFQYHAAAKEALDEAKKIMGVGYLKSREFTDAFHEATTRLARGDTSILSQYPDIAGQLQKSSTALRKAYDEMAEKAQRAGVQGAENLKGGEDYIPRKWNHNNIREAHAKYGDEVYQALADAIKVPGLKGDVAKAKSFLTAVSRTEFSHGLQDIQLMGRDMATLRAELGDPKYRLMPDEIDALVDVLFHVKRSEGDAGNAGNLKFRFNIDENHAMKMANGETFRIADLFENDARLLIDSYLQSMSGHVAMAERGFSSRADFMAAMREAEAFHQQHHALSEDGGRFTEHHQLLMDIYDHVVGRPMSMQSFNRADRILGAVRALSRSTFLGELGLPAAFEMKNAIALSSARLFWQHSGGFRGIIQSLRSGKIMERDLANSIEHMTGAGLEKIAAYARQHELTEFSYDKGLTGFENFANKASHAVDEMSGNAFFTSFTRQLSAAMFIQKHLDHITGKATLTEAQKLRMAGQGLDAVHLENTLQDLKAHTRMSPEGKALEIDYEGWQRNNMESYQRYQTTLSREMREAIQDHDIGETPPWIHSTLGKVAAELRTFALAAHSKQFLKGIHYKDRTTMMQWLWGFTGEMLAYSLQTSINYAHNPIELEKRLTLDKIAAASVGRMSTLGITPMLFETPYSAITGQKLFGSGTANTDNRDMLTTPSYTMFKRARETGLAGLQAMGFGNRQALSQEEARAAIGLLPGNNLWGMRNIADALTTGLPKKDHYGP